LINDLKKLRVEVPVVEEEVIEELIEEDLDATS